MKNRNVVAGASVTLAALVAWGASRPATPTWWADMKVDPTFKPHRRWRNVTPSRVTVALHALRGDAILHGLAVPHGTEITICEKGRRLILFDCYWKPTPEEQQS